MMGENMDLNLEKLEELVMDEELIVSCAVVSDRFQISLKEAKYLMNKFKEDQDATNSKNIFSMHLLSGRLKSGEYSINLLKKMDPNGNNASFENVNCSLYSIQRSPCLDFNILALSQDLTRSTPLKGSIVGKNCIERKLKVVIPPAQEKAAPKSKVNSFFKPVTKTENTDETNNDLVKTVSPRKKNGGIVGMFANMSGKTKPNADVKQEPSPKKIKCDAENDMVKKEPKSLESKENIQKKSNGLNGAAKQNDKKPKESSSKNSNGKKRKRIFTNDSDSDDLFAKSDEEKDVAMESVEEVPVVKKTTSPVPKNKRRKAVDKTYTDEDGYIVTKTEYVYESASDEDVIPEQKQEKPVAKDLKKTEKPQPAKKAPAKTKKVSGNQPTLMSFFKSK